MMTKDGLNLLDTFCFSAISAWILSLIFFATALPSIFSATILEVENCLVEEDVLEVRLVTEEARSCPSLARALKMGEVDKRVVGGVLVFVVVVMLEDEEQERARIEEKPIERWLPPINLTLPKAPAPRESAADGMTATVAGVGGVLVKERWGELRGNRNSSEKGMRVAELEGELSLGKSMQVSLFKIPQRNEKKLARKGIVELRNNIKVSEWDLPELKAPPIPPSTNLV